ncbi:terpene synthase family protein [Aspergillus neoniger CBS 115656]|uniref:Terpene synthase n=1 Tax=Aspergillus neoniger (strain CBS 115656) TaxID=1448310 RepID=A0A318YMF3_ASPNB|nr:terpenoid synthase [Aspergillus neoniger CBS 115656]PYH33883.1 terpenoid synthase [Aspergillus neoniger CBS 115656]
MKKNPPIQDVILQRLHGHTCFIPDLWSLIRNEPGGSLPEDYADANDFLSLLPGDPAKARKVKASDFPLLACLWWPHTSFRKLRVLAFLVVWLIVWDDELDGASQLTAYNLNMGQQFRDETRQYIGSSLELNSEQSDHITDNTIICGFSPIANFIGEEYDEEHRLTLAEEIMFVIDVSKVEQENRLGTDIPSTDQYLAYRLGTNLMGVICAATELSTHLRIPRSMTRSPLVKEIWHETNLIIAVTNDILSLKKEIARSPQTAVDISIQILKDSFADLDRIEADIVARSNQIPLTFLIESCRHYCAGFIEWSLRTPRYMLSTLPVDQTGAMILLF